MNARPSSGPDADPDADPFGHHVLVRVDTSSACSRESTIHASYIYVIHERTLSRQCALLGLPPPSPHLYRCLKMKSLLALLLIVTSILAHPVPEPKPVSGNPSVGQLLKRAGVVFSSCTVPNKVALTYVGS